eukprot:1278480-Pleurochrysis_carterae.AAC.1
MAQLDSRERELGLPLLYSALLNHPSPVRTPGFRGYFAGCRPVPAEVIQRYPHLTTEQAVALSDAELEMQTLEHTIRSATHGVSSLRVADSAASQHPKRDVPARRALDLDGASASPPSVPPSPPDAPSTPEPPRSHAPETPRRPACSLLVLSLLINAAVLASAVLLGIRFADESGAIATPMPDLTSIMRFS